MTITNQFNSKVIAEELARIAKANGGQLTPEDVVKNARAKSSPLHSHFTWDDDEAAERYRLVEASYLIRMVRVKVEMNGNEHPYSVRAFVNVGIPAEKSDDEEDDADPEEPQPLDRCYVPLKVAMKVDDYRQQMLDNAARDLRTFRNKYAILTELSKVFKAAEDFEQGRLALVSKT